MKYKVKSPIDYQPVGKDGKATDKAERLSEGDEIDLDEKTAKPLLEAGAIEASAKAEDKAKK